MSVSASTAEPIYNSKLFNTAISIGVIGIVISAAAICILCSETLNNAPELHVTSIDRLTKLSYLGALITVMGFSAGSAVALQPIAQDIKSYFLPSDKEKEERIASLEHAQESVQLIKARRAFRDCLIENRLNPDRGNSGLPSVCEPLAEAFAALGERKGSR